MRSPAIVVCQQAVDVLVDGLERYAPAGADFDRSQLAGVDELVDC
jgi:hypothetical protein